MLMCATSRDDCLCQKNDTNTFPLGRGGVNVCRHSAFGGCCCFLALSVAMGVNSHYGCEGGDNGDGGVRTGG